jgi:hypothetical protein
MPEFQVDGQQAAGLLVGVQNALEDILILPNVVNSIMTCMTPLTFD